jgi:transposase-like protein
MKAGQFSNEQIVAILQESTRGEKTIATLCREKGISEATFYTWRQKFGGLSTREVQRLRELEKENARLKKLLAERDLEIDCLKEINAKNW